MNLLQRCNGHIIAAYGKLRRLPRYHVASRQLQVQAEPCDGLSDADRGNAPIPLNSAGAERSHPASHLLTAMRLQRSAPARAAVLTGTYALVAGAALVLAPERAFSLLFDVASVPEPWVRVGGVLFAVFGLQYLGTGLWDPLPPNKGAVSFYKASIWSRCFLAAAFGAVAVNYSAPRLGLLVLAGINLMGALTMFLALHS